MSQAAGSKAKLPVSNRHKHTRHKPDLLKPGDTLALVSPASPFYRGEATPESIIAQARDALHALGLRTVVGAHALETHGYLAGSDAHRARDLMDAFANPEVNAIVCMGGGYGTPRLLDLLDYDVIAANPKIFVGYSDITALHTAIGQRADLVTFLGPMGFELARIRRTLCDLRTVKCTPGMPQSTRSGIQDATPPSPPKPDPAAATATFAWRWFCRAFMQPEALGPLPVLAPWQTHSLQCIVPGTAQGPLVGGNLSLLANTLGTPYEIDTAGKILLIEEVGEAPYRIDRMLTQLRLAGKLAATVGIIIAEWTDCASSDSARPSLTLPQILEDIVKPLGKPAVFGLAAGHGPGRLTLPLGVTTRLEAGTSSGTPTATASVADTVHSSCRVVVLEPGVQASRRPAL